MDNQTDAVSVPKQRQELLRSVCKENEENCICALVVREICTFSSVSREVMNSPDVINISLLDHSEPKH